MLLSSINSSLENQKSCLKTSLRMNSLFTQIQAQLIELLRKVVGDESLRENTGVSERILGHNYLYALPQWSNWRTIGQKLGPSIWWRPTRKLAHKEAACFFRR